MIIYSDELDRLKIFADNTFKRVSYSDEIDNPGLTKEEKIEKMRAANSRFWGAKEALLRCSENQLKDPMDILEDVKDEFDNISLWDCKQKINKDHFREAAFAVDELLRYLRSIR